MKLNRYVIGDIHGGYKALIQCLEKVKFNYSNDLLICLGDVCDGWPEVKESIDELTKIKNLIYILGNHDEWAIQWLTFGEIPPRWSEQGGKSTIASLGINFTKKYIDFLSRAKYYFTLDNILFVHGGFDPSLSIDQQSKDVLLWDRKLVSEAQKKHETNPEAHISSYKEIYIGHTPTLKFGRNSPLKFCELVLLDTGGGWPQGKLTIMNIDSHEYWSSRQLDLIYPSYNPRG